MSLVVSWGLLALQPTRCTFLIFVILKRQIHDDDDDDDDDNDDDDDDDDDDELSWNGGSSGQGMGLGVGGWGLNVFKKGLKPFAFEKSPRIRTTSLNCKLGSSPIRLREALCLLKRTSQSVLRSPSLWKVRVWIKRTRKWRFKRNYIIYCKMKSCHDQSFLSESRKICKWSQHYFVVVCFSVFFTITRWSIYHHCGNDIKF